MGHGQVICEDILCANYKVCKTIWARDKTSSVHFGKQSHFLFFLISVSICHFSVCFPPMDSGLGQGLAFGISLRACLSSVYFVETESFLLKVLYIKVKVSWNSIVGPWIVPKSAVEPINSSKNKLNNKINWL